MMKNLILLALGAIAGSVATFGGMQLTSCAGHVDAATAIGSGSAAALREPFTVTLYRFELKSDRLDRVDEWVQFEHAHHAETLVTLEREKMYAEAIFRDRDHQPDVIYWVTINGKGEHVDTSPLDIDKQYQASMRDTLKPGARRALTTEYALVPDFVVKAIDEHERGR